MYYYCNCTTIMKPRPRPRSPIFCLAHFYTSMHGPSWIGCTDEGGFSGLSVTAKHQPEPDTQNFNYIFIGIVNGRPRSCHHDPGRHGWHPKPSRQKVLPPCWVLWSALNKPQPDGSKVERPHHKGESS